jgi:hypothetical protein
MRSDKPLARARRRSALGVAAALVLADGWLGPVAVPAAAAFPGRNGKIACVSQRGDPV